MNILMLIDALNIGGAETHVVTLSRAIARRGDRVIVLSGGGLLEEELQRDGILCLRFPADINTFVGLLKNARFLGELTCRRSFDVLHAHTRRTALLLRLLPQCPPPALHPPPCYRARGWQRALSPLRVVTAHAKFSPRYRHLSYWGECTIAVSDDIRDHLRAAFGQNTPERAIHVIPNGVELPISPPSRRRDDEFCLVFASRLDDDCSLAAHLILRLLPALSRMVVAKGKRLRVAVLGGGNCFATLRRECAEMSTKLPHVTLILPGAMRDPSPYYARAQVFVGVSRAALEAAGQGCRVILAGNEGYGGCLNAENFAHHARSNFCARGAALPKEETLLADLRRLLDEDENQAAVRTLAVQRLIRQTLHVDRTADRTVRLYARALGEKRRLRVLCLGYFGRDNLGDQAILRMVARRFSGACAPSDLATTPWYTAPRAKEEQARIGAAPRGHRAGIFRARRTIPMGRTSFFPQRHARYVPRFFARDVFAHHAAAPAAIRTATVVPPSLTVGAIATLAKENADGRRLHEGLDVTPSFAPLALLRALCRADALLLGGGELWQNVSEHGALSLGYYLLVPAVAMACGCPFTLRAGGVGSVRGNLARCAVGIVARRAAGISLRDAASVDRLTLCGVPRERISPCQDGVVAWQERHASMAAPLPRRLQQGYVCVCPRDATAAEQARLIAAVRAEDPSLPRLFLAIGGEADLACCRAMAKQVGGAVVLPRDERSAAALLSQATAVISMRLHALVLAGNRPRLQAVPTATTQEKMQSFPQLIR